MGNELRGSLVIHRLTCVDLETAHLLQFSLVKLFHLAYHISTGLGGPTLHAHKIEVSFPCLKPTFISPHSLPVHADTNPTHFSHTVVIFPCHTGYFQAQTQPQAPSPSLFPYTQTSPFSLSLSLSLSHSLIFCPPGFIHYCPSGFGIGTRVVIAVNGTKLGGALRAVTEENKTRGQARSQVARAGQRYMQDQDSSRQ
jgi:hypothetical protein